MSKNKSILSLIGENKSLFVIILIGLFLIELEILSVAVIKSGKKSTLEVLDGNGTLIYEADGKTLTDFNRYYFERTFGPLEKYQVRLVTREEPFPFRAWFVAAIGVPVGAILLLGFVVKAYIVLFHGDDSTRTSEEPEDLKGKSRLEQIFSKVARLNIFTIGFFIFFGVFLYWVIPNLITYIGRVGVETLSRYRWVFLGIAVVMVLLLTWLVYLRYLLAKKTIESHIEIDKYRLQLEYDAKAAEQRLMLGYEDNRKAPPQATAWEQNNADGKPDDLKNADRNNA